VTSCEVVQSLLRHCAWVVGALCCHSVVTPTATIRLHEETIVDTERIPKRDRFRSTHFFSIYKVSAEMSEGPFSPTRPDPTRPDQFMVMPKLEFSAYVLRVVKFILENAMYGKINPLKPYSSNCYPHIGIYRLLFVCLILCPHFCNGYRRRVLTQGDEIWQNGRSGWVTAQGL